MRQQRGEYREHMDHVQVSHVEEQRYPAEYDERLEESRIAPALCSPQEQADHAECHQKELQRWRILLDIEEQDHGPGHRRLQMPIALADASESRWRIAIHVGESQGGDHREGTPTQSQ